MFHQIDHILQGLELHVKLVVGFVGATRWIGRSGHARRPLLFAFFGTGSELTAIAAPVHPAFVLTREPLGQTVHHTQGHGLSLLAPAPRLLLLFLLLVSSSRLLLLLSPLILKLLLLASLLLFWSPGENVP